MMCFRGRKAHLCVICLLIYSVIPDVSHSLDSGTKPINVNHTEEQHLQQSEGDNFTSVTVEYFLHELMNKYGNGQIMSFEGFEHLLEELNLADIVFMDHTVECHKSSNNSDFISFHSSHNHSEHATVSSDLPCSTEHQKGIAHGDHKHSVDNDGHDHGDPGHLHNHDPVDSPGNTGEADHSDHKHPEYDLSDQTKLNKSAESIGAVTDKTKLDHEDDHSNHDHEHSDHSDHDHEHDDHSDHDHEHDHSDHDHEHSDHSDHDHEHDDHSDHDHEHDDHSDHDHEHDAHSDHDHEELDESDVDHADLHSTNHSQNKRPSESATNGVKIRKRAVKSSDSKCLPPALMLSLVNSDKSQGLTKEMFVRLCPALIYQLESGLCDPHLGDHDHLHDDHDHEHPVASEKSSSGVSGKVWGFSTIAVIIISLVGLLGVAVIPIVQKVFYNHLLQFLVALAVGALTGDALLHLLPHAIAGGHAGEGGDADAHDHSSHGAHKHDLDPIYKGLCGLLGIYFFFLTERILTIVTDMKRRKKKKKNRRRYTPEEDEVDRVGEKLANSDMECDEVMMSIHPNKDGSSKEVWLMNQEALQGYADEAHTEHCTISFANSSSISHQHGHRHSSSGDKVHTEEDVTIISHPSNGHGHGHSHCKDGVPKSVSAIAWMVIFGDGIHNFSDGLAIGAAFANSITGGFSTSIAVFCHELPHEIGDFAMLLRAGMSPKQAIIYNCVSSILCFVGMVIGVAIGNVHNASLWIFAIVGGMFLYIALVDMLPEMSSVDTKQGEHPFFHLLLQLLGMLLGAGIMLLIALYEEDLKNVFE